MTHTLHAHRVLRTRLSKFQSYKHTQLNWSWSALIAATGEVENHLGRYRPDRHLTSSAAHQPVAFVG